MGNPIPSANVQTGPEPQRGPGQPVQYSGKQKIILEAAHSVFSEKGIKDATITEIAGRAGVVDSVIYHYFKNKDDVIFSVLDLQLQNNIVDLTFHFKGIIDPLSKFGKMIWYHLSMNNQGDTQMRKNMLLELRSHRNFTEHKSYETLLQYIGVMDNILNTCVHEGSFRSDLNIPLLRTIILGFLDEEGLMCAAKKQPADTLDDFDAVMDLVLAMATNTPPVVQPESDRPDKYQRILKAAKTLYAEKGFTATTMNEVASLAGVAEGTIYEYFKNKQDLLLSITREMFGGMKDALDNAFNINHPYEKFRWLIWHHFTIFASDRDLVSVFLKDTKLEKFFYEDAAHEVFVRYHDKICDVLEEGKASGVFRPDIDTRVFRNLVMGGLAAAYNRWYFRQPIAAMDYMTELHQFTDMICCAAASPVPPAQ